jgi:succinate-semialdehyde dehydrogenase/glutarate-semialdehyde dehydrogenase
LAHILLDAGLPPGRLAVLHGSGDTVGRAVLDDQRVGFYTLTGSTAVGRIVQQAAGLRRTQLELGSIASTIVCADADLDRAVPKIVAAAMRKSGQVCTSVQRLYVEAPVLDRFTAAVASAVETLVAGDPRDPRTGIGPLISAPAADRVMALIDAARAAGARVVRGGERAGSVVTPTLLDRVADDMDVMRREIFGPAICAIPFTRLRDAVEQANNTPFGLAAGIFTQDIDRAVWAARRLRFGGVHINEASSARVDLMPFGGVKDSGHGLEGPLYAAREMSEQRLITITASEPAD